MKNAWISLEIELNWIMVPVYTTSGFFAVGRTEFDLMYLEYTFCAYANAKNETRLGKVSVFQYIFLERCLLQSE